MPAYGVPPVQPPPIGAGPSSEPQYTLSNIVPATGQPTGGYKLFVGALQESLQSLDVWERDATTLLWALRARVTPPHLAKFKWITICGSPPIEIYFNLVHTEAPSTPIVFVQEIAG